MPRRQTIHCGLNLLSRRTTGRAGVGTCSRGRRWRCRRCRRSWRRARPRLRRRPRHRSRCPGARQLIGGHAPRGGRCRSRLSRCLSTRTLGHPEHSRQHNCARHRYAINLHVMSPFEKHELQRIRASRGCIVRTKLQFCRCCRVECVRSAGPSPLRSSAMYHPTTSVPQELQSSVVCLFGDVKL